MTTISAIIPVYNRAHLIGATIRSILAQTVQPLEIIVVDDGSIDDISRLLLYSEPYSSCVKYIYQQNAGPSAARNRGIEAARGEFIALCDSDDLWPKYKLENQVALLAKHPELDVVFGLERKFSQDPKCKDTGIVHNYPPLQEGLVSNPYELLIGLVNMPTSSLLVRREKAVPFNPSLRLCEDRDWLLTIAGRGRRFGFVDAVCAERRVHSGSLANQTVALKEAMVGVLESRMHIFDHQCTELASERISDLCYDTGSHYLKALQFGKARDHLAKVKTPSLKLTLKRVLARVGLAFSTT